MEKDWIGRGMRKMLGLATAWATAMALCVCIGCSKTLYVPVERVTHDTLVVVKRDSVVREKVSYQNVYVKDSMWMQVVNDTCYIDRWHTRKEMVYVTDSTRTAKDSARVEVRVDSVPKIVEVEKRVAYVPPVLWWLIGGMAIGIVILIILLKIKKVSNLLNLFS